MTREATHIVTVYIANMISREYLQIGNSKLS